MIAVQQRRRRTITADRITVALLVAAGVNLIAVSAYPLMNAKAATTFADRGVARGDSIAIAEAVHGRRIQTLPIPCQEQRIDDGRTRGCEELLRWQHDQQRNGSRPAPAADGDDHRADCKGMSPPDASNPRCAGRKLRGSL